MFNLKSTWNEPTLWMKASHRALGPDRCERMKLLTQEICWLEKVQSADLVVIRPDLSKGKLSDPRGIVFIFKWKMVNNNTGEESCLARGIDFVCIIAYSYLGQDLCPTQDETKELILFETEVYPQILDALAKENIKEAIQVLEAHEEQVNKMILLAIKGCKELAENGQRLYMPLYNAAKGYLQKKCTFPTPGPDNRLGWIISQFIVQNEAYLRRKPISMTTVAGQSAHCKRKRQAAFKEAQISIASSESPNSRALFDAVQSDSILNDKRGSAQINILLTDVNSLEESIQHEQAKVTLLQQTTMAKAAAVEAKKRELEACEADLALVVARQQNVQDSLTSKQATLVEKKRILAALQMSTQ